MPLAAPGIRVIRGPDWNGGDLDGGEGGVGTIVEVLRSPNKDGSLVMVRWDNGKQSQCRAGHMNAHDLRVVDIATVGIRHDGKHCVHCGDDEDSAASTGVPGILWVCNSCPDVSLCTSHYMHDKHDLSHSFLRLDSPSSAQQPLVAQMVPPRKGSQKVMLRGLFEGAKVQRSADWIWQDQDGGQGKPGKLLQVQNWNKNSVRSVANISWMTTGITNVYRIGHKGKVDVHCIQPSNGGQCYIDHLPILGQQQSLSVGLPRKTGEAALAIPQEQQPRHTHTFSIGDRVQISVRSAEDLQRIQESHGGFNPKMLEVMEVVGEVHRLTSNGDVRVQYPGHPASAFRWTINPVALKHVDFKIGDHVRLIDDVEAVQRLQVGHGGWSEDMARGFSNVGRIIKIYPDNDVRVSLLGKEWTFNPVCLQRGSSDAALSAVPEGCSEKKQEGPSPPSASSSAAAEAAPTTVDRRDEEAFIRASANGDLQFIRLLLAKGLRLPSKLVRSSLQEACLNGHLEIVREVVERYPQEVFYQIDGKTVLQVSAHRGHLAIVKFLLSDEARRPLLDARDHEGDSALHYAAYGKKTQVIDYLLAMGADINAVNVKKCSVLHVSVLVNDIETARLLLSQASANVNIRDAYEDTPLHEAIVKDSHDMIEAFCQHPDIDFTIANKRGFNLVQYAALKGSLKALKKITEVTQGALLNVRKDDGFTPLHLAALNGHVEVVAYLLGLSEVDLLVVDARGRNSLHCAIHQGHANVIELLVEEAKERNLLSSLVQAVDIDGDSPLHIALRREGEPQPDRVQADGRPRQYSGTFQSLMSTVESSGLVPKLHLHPITIAAFLLAQGAKLGVRNKANYTPLDYVFDANIRLFLNQCDKPKPSKTAATDAPMKETNCQICCEPMKGNLRPVRFEPCGHIIVCLECCSRMKRCLQCKAKIDRKIPALTLINDDASDGDGTEDEEVRSLRTMQLHALEAKVQDFEQHYLCGICMEKKKTVAFMCGHGTCEECATTLQCCHMCRGPTSHKINLY